MTEWLSGAFFVAGATLALLSAIGVLRMPDVFTRMQASTKASTLGLACLLAGLAIRRPETAIVFRVLTIGAFMMLTTAVAAHVIARAAALTRVPLWEGTIVDERIREDDEAGEQEP
jgi:multicomponent Na+:H+ antiporter subunit G